MLVPHVLVWVSVRLALVSLTLASTSLVQLETLAFLATAAARSTALAPADWSASNLDRQLWDQKAAIAHSNIIRQLWVASSHSCAEPHPNARINANAHSRSPITHQP
jgi:hypothetical protein